MARIGPVILETPGDRYLPGALIAAIIWDGSTTSGDRVILRHGDGEILWQGRTDSATTYLGANIGPYGIHAPNGFYVDQLDSGTLLVYLAEKF